MMLNVSLATAVAFYFVGVLSGWLSYCRAWWELAVLLLVSGGLLLVAELKRPKRGVLILLALVGLACCCLQLLYYQTQRLTAATTEVEVLVRTVTSSNKWWTEYECSLQTIGGRPAAGSVLLRHGGQVLEPGQVVKALVKTEAAAQAKNWAPYDQQKYLMINGHRGIVKTTKVLSSSPGQGLEARWYRAVAALQTGLSTKLKEEPSGLTAALLVGNKTALSPEAKYDLQGAGVSHIVALSGFHLVMLIALVELVLLPLTRRPQGHLWVNLAIAALTGFYLILTGFQTSLVRAALMLLCVRGLRWSGVNALIVTAAVMVAFKPLLLLEVGFQLSVLAVAGLVLLVDRQIKGKLWQELNTYVAVQLLILPILAWNFGFISLWGLLGNLLLTPLSVAIMILGLLYLGLSVVGVGIILKPALVVVAEIFLGIGKSLAGLPFSFLYLGRGNFGVWVCYYVALALWLWWRHKPGLTWQVGWWEFRYRLAKYKRTAVGIALGLTLFLILAWPKPTLKVFFLDVGEGDCSVITTPKGRVIVIDTGKGLEFRDFLRSHAISEIDLLLLTHPHADHYKGLTYCLDEIAIHNAFLWPQVADPEYKRLYEDLQASGTRLVKPVPGQSLLAQEGISLKFYLPQAEMGQTDWNQKGIMLKLGYGRHSFLYTADSGAPVLDSLAKQLPDGRFTVVKVPHHGSRLSWSNVFWQKVEARWAVISVGKNFYGHPSEQVVEGLNQLGIAPLRTDIARGLCFECSETKVAINQFKDD